MLEIASIVIIAEDYNHRKQNIKNMKFNMEKHCFTVTTDKFQSKYFDSAYIFLYLKGDTDIYSDAGEPLVISFNLRPLSDCPIMFSFPFPGWKAYLQVTTASEMLIYVLISLSSKLMLFTASGTFLNEFSS